MNHFDLIDRLNQLNKEELTELLENFTDEDLEHAGNMARGIADSEYGRIVYVRALIKFSDFCKNNCKYCSRRCINHNLERNRLTKVQIIDNLSKAYDFGLRSFILQSGEDLHYSDDSVCDIVESLKERYEDAAVTLSIGEKSDASYERFLKSGVDRYFLMHRSADRSHYEMLHPSGMNFENRIKSLVTLKKTGFQTGCGPIVGLPYQKPANLVEDLLFMKNFKPDMAIIKPFIPAVGTPFADSSAPNIKLLYFMIALTRILLPKSIIPAVETLNLLAPSGRMKALDYGCNSVIVELTPEVIIPAGMYTTSTISKDINKMMDIFDELGAAGYIPDRSRGDVKRY